MIYILFSSLATPISVNTGKSTSPLYFRLYHSECFTNTSGHCIVTRYNTQVESFSWSKQHQEARMSLMLSLSPPLQLYLLMDESFKFICCTLNTDNFIYFTFNAIPQRIAEEQSRTWYAGAKKQKHHLEVRRREGYTLIQLCSLKKAGMDLCAKCF